MKTLLSLTILVTFSACSASKDEVEIQVSTGIPVRSRPASANIKQGFSHLMNVNVGTDCYQDNTFLMVYDPAIDQVIAQKKVKFKSRYANPTPVPALTFGYGSLDVDYLIDKLNPGGLNTTSFDEPLSIVIPKNHPVEVALLSTFYSPADGDNDGICDETSGGYASHSFHLFGHTLVSAAALQTGVVNLNINVLGTNPTGGTYTLTPAHKDWVEIDYGFNPSFTKNISAGTSHTCAVVKDAAYCWGYGTSGQLGNNGITSYNTPQAVNSLTWGSGVTAISAGMNHTCAVAAGSAKCWGMGTSGELGNGGVVQQNIPVQVSGLVSGVTAIGAGASFSCAIVSGAVKCWGIGALGELGNGSFSNSSIPVQVTGLTSGVTKLTVGSNHACAVMNNSVYCWGKNSNGQVGDNSNTNRNTPVQINMLPVGQIQSLSAGNLHTCAVVNFTAYCWGANGSYQLGDNTNIDKLIPTSVMGINNVTSIATGASHSCAIYDDYINNKKNLVKCWGSNASGELGNGSNTIPTVAGTPIPMGSPFAVEDETQIELGSSFGCVISKIGPQCWGYNTTGQVGDATNADKWIPTNVNSLLTGATRLRTAHFLREPVTNADQAHVKLDYDGVHIYKYYLPHMYPISLDFQFSGISEMSGCLSGAPCTGIYRAVINEGNNSNAPFLEATLIQTLSGAPPLTLGPQPGSPFKMKNY